MRLAGIAYRAVNRLAYLAYVGSTRLAQAPAVFAERSPGFVRDELIRAAQGDEYAVVVKYSLFGMEDGFDGLLDALARQGVNTIVVFNGEPSAAQLAAAQKSAHRLIVRRNVGRDFGAYRAITLKLVEEGVTPGRILFFNDSLIYIPGADLDRLIGAFRDRTYDVTGAFENHTGEHHVGSFAFSLSGAVFSHPVIVDFWRNYTPWDIRTHAIHRGEMALSRAYKKAGFRVDVVYSIPRLAQRLDTMTTDGLTGLMRYLPSTPGYGTRLTAPAAPMAVMEPIKAIVERDGGTASHSGTMVADRTLRDSLIDQLVSSVLSNSQIHVGFGLFRRVMKCPLVKKDLLLHNVFYEHECLRILEDLPPRQLNVILRQLINRGRPVHQSRWRRFKLRNGLI